MFLTAPQDDFDNTLHPGELSAEVKVKKPVVPRHLRIADDSAYYMRSRRYMVISVIILLALVGLFGVLAAYLCSLGSLTGGAVVLPGIVLLA